MRNIFLHAVSVVIGSVVGVSVYHVLWVRPLIEDYQQEMD